MRPLSLALALAVLLLLGPALRAQCANGSCSFNAPPQQQSYAYSAPTYGGNPAFGYMGQPVVYDGPRYYQERPPFQGNFNFYQQPPLIIQQRAARQPLLSINVGNRGGRCPCGCQR